MLANTIHGYLGGLAPSDSGATDDDEVVPLVSSSHAMPCKCRPCLGMFLAVSIVLAAPVSMHYGVTMLMQSGPGSLSSKDDENVMQAGPLKQPWNETRAEQQCGNQVWAKPLPLIDDGTRDPPAPGDAWAEIYLNRTEVSTNFSDPMPLFDGVLRFKFSNGGTMTYYGSADMQQDLPSSARLAVIAIGGVSRIGMDAFCIMRQVLQKQTTFSTEETLLVSLKFNKGVDQPLRSSDMWWNGSHAGFWHLGHDSDNRSGAVMSSYHILDGLILHLADKAKYPHLTDIVLAGHSGGGQVIQRYSVVSRLKPPQLSSEQDVKNELGVRSDLKLRFVIANPSTYLYFDTHRWAYTCGDTDSEDFCTSNKYEKYDFSDGRHGWHIQQEYGHLGYRGTEGLGQTGEDHPFICRCHNWNSWPYGIGNLSGFSYAGHIADLMETIRIFPERNIVFLAGQNDTCTEDQFLFCDETCWTRNISTSLCFRNAMNMQCAAMLQGPNRHERSGNYMQHLQSFFGRKVHRHFVIPNAGHQMLQVLSSRVGLLAITGQLPIEE